MIPWRKLGQRWLLVCYKAQTIMPVTVGEGDFFAKILFSPCIFLVIKINNNTLT